MFLLLFATLTNLWALQPTEYINKPELKAKTQVVGSKIFFQYGFKDLNGVYQEWSWQDDYSKLKNLSDQFGISIKDPSNVVYYDSDLAPGLFENHPLVGIIPDYNKLISLYQDTVVEIYRNWSRTVQAQDLNRRDSIELLLRFLQDYPYGVPPDIIGRKFIAGLLVPPLSLETGWADCDSKSLLMATILSFDPYFKDKLAMILVPGHALLGVEMLTLPYDETYKYRHRTFVVAEPTGLSRTPFGRKNSPYSRLIGIIPLKSPERIAFSTSTQSESGLQALVESDCPDEGLLVEYFSSSENGKIQQCVIKVNNEYVKHGPLLKYDAAGQPIAKEIYNRGAKI